MNNPDMAIDVAILTIALWPLVNLLPHFRRRMAGLRQTGDPRTRYRILCSRLFGIFICFGLTGFLALAVAGRGAALVTLPSEFSVLRADFLAEVARGQKGMLIGAAVG